MALPFIFYLKNTLRNKSFCNFSTAHFNEKEKIRKEEEGKPSCSRENRARKKNVCWNFVGSKKVVFFQKLSDHLGGEKTAGLFFPKIRQLKNNNALMLGVVINFSNALHPPEFYEPLDELQWQLSLQDEDQGGERLCTQPPPNVQQQLLPPAVLFNGNSKQENSRKNLIARNIFSPSNDQFFLTTNNKHKPVFIHLQMN